MKRVFKTNSFVIALTMAALMTGSQALGQNLEPVAGLGATYYPNIMYESDTVHLNWLGPLNVTEPPQYFRIYRTDADTNEPYTEANTALIADSVVGQEYLVSNFGQLPKGKYKYGVSAVYDVGYVPPAPGVLISENFENGIPSNWTLIDADNDGDNWFAGDPVAYGIGQAHSGSKVVSSWSWNNMTLNPDHYMIIPLQGVATQMRFFAATNVAYPDHYGVFVSSTTMDLDSFRLVFEESWSSLAPARERETSAGQRGSAAGAPSAIRAMSAWKEVTVDLPSDARYVAFRHYNSYDNNYLFIDDITVYGEISNFWKPGQADIYWSLPIERGTAPERLRVSESGLAEWLEGAGTENPYTPTLLLLQDTLGNIVFRDTTYNNYLQLPFDQLTDSTYYDCLIAYIHSFGMSDTIQTRWLKVPTGPFTITVTAKPLAGGAVFGEGVYKNGDTCTLSVSSYRGYYLSYWTVNDSTVSNDSVYSFVVTEDANCVAHFDRFPYSITAKAEPADYGTVEGAGTYKHFDAATLLAKPNKGYQFVRWTLNGEEVSTTAMYSFLVTGPAEYVAHFELYNALENVSGEPGTQKLLRNGILYILRSGILYDSLGRKITN